ncbi:MAG: type II toxin-antitoxin system VapC family toxin [Candidatus Riflebacteria bacterium]|nr:type II toxin-antitoxin system VapC family toxin [Candidatus Riflebacteria bacterium]
MYFWDTSAILPILVHEPMSPVVESLARGDPALAVWWATRTECVSALARRARDGALDVKSETEARRVLSALAGAWSEVLPTDPLRTTAERLLSVHTLRAADALQIAAALQWCRGNPSNAGFVCLDSRLRDAARKEGFTVLPV